MKKLLILLFVSVLAFAGCDEKPKVRPGEIAGKWQYKEVTIQSTGGSAGLAEILGHLVEELPPPMEQDAVYSFKSNKTGKFTSSTENNSFTYTLSGTQLIMIDDNDGSVDIRTIHSITDARMVWTLDITNEVNEELVVYFPNLPLFDKVIYNMHFTRQ